MSREFAVGVTHCYLNGLNEPFDYQEVLRLYRTSPTKAKALFDSFLLEFEKMDILTFDTYQQVKNLLFKRSDSESDDLALTKTISVFEDCELQCSFSEV